MPHAAAFDLFTMRGKVTAATCRAVSIKDAAVARLGYTPELVEPIVADSQRASILATVAINALALALPIFVLQIYDRVLPNQTALTLSVLAFGLALALAADVSLRLMRAYVATWTAARVEHVLRCRMMASMLGTSLEAFARHTPATYLDALNAIATLREFEAAQRVEIRVDLAFALIYLAMIAYLGGWLVLIPVVLLVLFVLAGRRVGQLLHRSVSARTEADNGRYDHMLAIFNGIQTVKALALNGMLMRRLEGAQERSAHAVSTHMSHVALAQTVSVLFTQVNTVALLGFGAVLVLEANLSMGGLAACTLLSGRALQPIQTAMSAWANFQSIRIAREQVAATTDLPPELQNSAERFELNGALVLDAVTYRVPGAALPILNQVSLRAGPGEIVAIKGAPGAGKTSLLHVILGLLQPESGHVTIDGRLLSSVALDSYRRQVALLPRHGAVFGGTILDNLSNFRDGESAHEALYLGYLLGLDDPIRRLPLGFDTLVESGDVLPAGLRQRIAIVRELVNRPKLILFDEADGAMDSDSRQRLVGLLRQFGQDCTMILISSSPDVLALASRRYLLEEGHLLPVSSLPENTGVAR